MNLDNFQFFLYSPDGTPLRILNNVVDVTWVRTVNQVGSCTLQINPKDIDYELFTRQDAGLLIESGTPLVPDLDTFWFLRGFNESLIDKRETLTLNFEDANSLLARRIVSLPADSPQGSEPRTRLDAPANLAMRDLVQDIVSIPTNGRDWSNNITFAP